MLIVIVIVIVNAIAIVIVIGGCQCLHNLQLQLIIFTAIPLILASTITGTIDGMLHYPMRALIEHNNLVDAIIARRCNEIG